MDDAENPWLNCVYPAENDSLRNLYRNRKKVSDVELLEFNAPLMVELRACK